MRTHLFSILLILGVIAPAGAQTSSTRTLTSGGVDSSFFLAPDFKFTDINGDFANLAGAYGGWMIDKKLLIGGGAYTLTNGSGPDGMTYGGGVVEYFVNQDSLVNVSLRALVGGGDATLGSNAPNFARDLDFGRVDVDRFRGNSRLFPNVGRRGGFENLLDLDLDHLDEQFRTSSSFFIAEPELDVLVNVSEMFRLSFGGSYRFIGGAGRLNDRLDGFAASVALKMIF